MTFVSPLHRLSYTSRPVHLGLDTHTIIHTHHFTGNCTHIGGERSLLCNLKKEKKTHGAGITMATDGGIVETTLFSCKQTPPFPLLHIPIATI